MVSGSLFVGLFLRPEVWGIAADERHRLLIAPSLDSMVYDSCTGRWDSPETWPGLRDDFRGTPGT